MELPVFKSNVCISLRGRIPEKVLLDFKPEFDANQAAKISKFWKSEVQMENAKDTQQSRQPL